MNCKVSIIVASYNYAQYISKTIESVIAQTYSDWELIIVDDGSKDNSINVIEEYCKQDNRIKLFTHDNRQNKGLIETIELGIKESVGKYITFIESDDYISCDYIEKKIKLFEKYEDLGLIYNNVQCIDNKPSEFLSNRIAEIENYWSLKNKPVNVGTLFCYANYIPTFSCVMVKKNLIENCNFDCPKPPLLDWWLWVQIVSQTKIYFINEKLTYWRIHSNSYISQEDKYALSYKEQYYFCKFICNFGKPKSFMELLRFLFIKKLYYFVKFNILILLENFKEKKN